MKRITPIRRKARHITVRIPGNVLDVLNRRMKSSGLDRTHVICELILYADRHASGTKEGGIK